MAEPQRLAHLSGVPLSSPKVKNEKKPENSTVRWKKLQSTWPWKTETMA